VTEPVDRPDDKLRQNKPPVPLGDVKAVRDAVNRELPPPSAQDRIGNGAPAGPAGAAQAPGQAAGYGPAPTLEWHGPTWGLARTGLLNFFLSMVTLGIYGFWGRTEVRKRIWSSIHLNGEPLAYTGTGKELFLGFLIVFGVILIPLFGLSIAGVVLFGPGSAGFIQALLIVGLIFLGGVAAYRARRYRLSRTTWRGIRGALEGSSAAFGWSTFWTTLFVPFVVIVAAGAFYVGRFGFARPSFETPVQQQAFFQANWLWITLSYAVLIVGSVLIVPWRTTKLNRQITNDMTFGSLPFKFTGSSRSLYARFIGRWVGVIVLFFATPAAMYWWIGQPRLVELARASQTGRPSPTTMGETVGLVAIFLVASLLYSVLTAWYKALELNYFASATTYDGQPFKLNVTAPGLIWLVLTNAPMSLFTLGILKPVAQARTTKYIIDHMTLEGPVDFDAVRQSMAARSKTGEGLAQAFDVDAF
jgi:uncharacterized membrane protein YjgN (DUF898 family)